jgi:hypothetical protein
MEFIQASESYILIFNDGVYTIIEKSQDIAVFRCTDREEAEDVFDNIDETSFEGFTPRFILEDIPDITE